MTGENDESYTTSKRFITPLSQIERIAIILWAIVSIAVVVIAGLMNFHLVGTFAIYPPGAVLVLLIIVPIILYMVPQSVQDSPKISNRIIIVVIVLFLIPGIVVSILGFSLIGISYALFIFGLGFIVPVLYLWHRKGLKLITLGFSLGAKRNIIVSIIITVIYGFLVFIQLGYSEWIGFIALTGFMLDLNSLVFVLIAFLLGFLFALTAAALPEELVFRTVLQSYFSTRNGRLIGILVASLIFGLFHLFVNMLLYESYLGSSITPIVFLSALTHCILFQAQGGIIFGVSWERTRSLFLPVMLHTIHNTVELLPYILGVLLAII